MPGIFFIWANSPSTLLFIDFNLDYLQTYSHKKCSFFLLFKRFSLKSIFSFLLC